MQFKSNQNNMETIKNLAKSLVKAQSQIAGAISDSKNPFFNSKYADLESVTNAIKKPLAENGLCYIQKVHRDNNFIGVETIIIHESGESIGNGITWVPVTKNDAHGFGAGLTYARRYSLASGFGVIQMDDDGNGAIGNQKPITKPQPVTNVKQLPKRKLTPELRDQIIGRFNNGETDIIEKSNQHIEITDEFKKEFAIATGVAWH